MQVEWTLECFDSLKGIVQPKMRILALFTLIPSSCSKPVWIYFFYCFCWAQKKTFWRMLVTKQLLVAIDFHSIFFPYYGSQWLPSIVRLPTFFKTSSFVFNSTNKFIQVWNNLMVSKLWQNFHFWLNYPFKYIFICHFIITSILFEIWLKCVDEFTDTHLW